MKKNKTYVSPPTFDLIERAANGDEEAIKAILKHYRRFTEYRSRRFFYDESGLSRPYIDEESCQKIEKKL